MTVKTPLNGYLTLLNFLNPLYLGKMFAGLFGILLCGKNNANPGFGQGAYMGGIIFLH